MSKNTTPVYPYSSALGGTFITTANTLKDGAGVLNFLISGGTNETRVDSVEFRQATSGQTTVNTSMVCRAFYSPPTATNTLTSSNQAFLVGEVALAAVTPSASAIGTAGTIWFTPPLVLPTSGFLYVTQSVYAGGDKDKIAALARGANY